MQKTITAENIQSFCRSCLHELQQKQAYNIQAMDVQIRQWLEDATAQEPPMNDSLPLFVCRQCRDKLECFLEFHRMCSRSRQALLDILKNKRHRQTLGFDFVDMPNSDQIATYKRMLEELKDTTSSSENEEPTFNIDSPVPFDYLEQEYTDNDEEEIKGTTYIESVENVAEETEVYEEYDQKTSNEINSTTDESMTRGTTTDTKQQCGNFNQETLDCDARIQQGLLPYQCPNCEESFNTLNRLRAHLNEIHATQKIICEYEGCTKEFWRSETYRDHCQDKHRQAKGEKIHKHICEECGKQYKTAYSLRIHQYSHKTKDEYPFHCNICNKGFVQRQPCIDHELRHAGIRNYECPHCGVKRTTKYELKKHINYHTKERQWPCPKCPMIFNSATNFHNHDKVVHQRIKRYDCSFCGKSFGAYHVLKMHKMRHTGERPHKCLECGKTYVEISSLKSHMKVHNKLAKKKSGKGVATALVTQKVLK